MPRPVKDEIDVTTQQRSDGRLTVHIKLIGWTRQDVRELCSAMTGPATIELRRIMETQLATVGP